MQCNNFFKKNQSLVTFLLLEVLGLLAFSFANIPEILIFIGCLLSIVAFVFAIFIADRKTEFLNIVPPVIILIIVSVFASFGGFSNSFNGFSNLVTLLAIPLFFVLGYSCRRLDEFNIKHTLIAIGFGFAIITLISTISTQISYGFFYSLIYKIKGTTNYYYNGVPYDVTKEMYWLIGFKFSEVSLEYGGLFAVLCGAFAPGLLFISPKENRNEFISVACIGGVGIISLLTIPNFKALIILLIASVFAFLYRFLKSKKPVMYGFAYGVFGIVLIGVVFYFLTIINAAIGFKFSSRIFETNSIMKIPSEILKVVPLKTADGIFNKLGINLTNETLNVIGGLNSVVFSKCGIFEYQIIKEVGIPGAILFVLFLLGMVYFVFDYVKKENDQGWVKAVIVVFLIAFFLYSSLFEDILPQTHEEGNYIPFLRSAPLMIALFLLGTIYFAPKAKEENK